MAWASRGGGRINKALGSHEKKLKLKLHKESQLSNRSRDITHGLNCPGGGEGIGL